MEFFMRQADRNNVHRTANYTYNIQDYNKLLSKIEMSVKYNLNLIYYV